MASSTLLSVRITALHPHSSKPNWSQAVNTNTLTSWIHCSLSTSSVAPCCPCICSAPRSLVAASWIPESTISSGTAEPSFGIGCCGEAVVVLPVPPTARQKLETPASVQKRACEPGWRAILKSILGRLPSTLLPLFDIEVAAGWVAHRVERQEGVKFSFGRFFCQLEDNKSKVAGSMVFVAGL